jgi:hypothetical protein
MARLCAVALGCAGASGFGLESARDFVSAFGRQAMCEVRSCVLPSCVAAFHALRTPFGTPARPRNRKGRRASCIGANRLRGRETAAEPRRTLAAASALLSACSRPTSRDRSSPWAAASRTASATLKCVFLSAKSAARPEHFAARRAAAPPAPRGYAPPRRSSTPRRARILGASLDGCGACGAVAAIVIRRDSFLYMHA